MDHATSTSPAVQAQLDRIAALSPGADVLGLSRIRTLLDRLGDPHSNLAPVFHVAGTNGKGSTCAFLRAALEADGKRVHVYTSPHLVRFNERIRLAGTLIADDALAALLARVLDRAEGIGASFFEVTTAAAFLAFAEASADACVIEVGLGGRLDATNVLPAPAACGIAALGIDHQSFLGDTLLAIAGEKAGIAKPAAPLLTMDYPRPIAARVAEVASAVGAPVLARGVAWHSASDDSGIRYEDRHGRLDLPRPAIAGPHQAENFALATAMLRHQPIVSVAPEAVAAAGTRATWPARMQRLRPGPLTRRLAPPPDPFFGIHVDGAHNPSAARPVGEWWASVARGLPTVLIVGLLANKDADGVLAALCAPVDATVIAVPVPGHEHHAPESLAGIARHCRARAAMTAGSLEEALDRIAAHALGHSILIAGSLYLAGEALATNHEEVA